MKRIAHCKNCGERIIDGEFCPVCGEKINYEVRDMEKTRRTRKILLVILAITIITGAIMVSTALLNNNQTVKITDTASLEMPVGNGINSTYVTGTHVHKVTNGKGVVIMAYNSKNSNLADAFGFDVVKSIAVGDIDNNDQIHETTINGSTKYSIATVNEDTGDHILITTHNKDDTMRIYHSIKYNASNVKNTTNKTTTSTTNQQTKNTANQQKTGVVTNTNNKDTSSRSYAEIARDEDVHTNKEKSDELNNHIVGCDENGRTYYTDGSYTSPKI